MKFFVALFSYLCGLFKKLRAAVINEPADPRDEAKPGHMFVVNEGTGIVGKGSYFFTTHSKENALVYYYLIEDEAKEFGGLYPDNGVQEISINELDRINRIKVRKESEVAIRFPGQSRG